MLARELSKPCFCEPPSVLLWAADQLSMAVDAHLAGDHEAAKELFRATDRTDIREWTESLWGPQSPFVSYREVASAPPRLKLAERPRPRMPSAAGKAALIRRDGFHCRFCHLPVIRAEVRKHLQAAYPAAIRWGTTNQSQHASFQAMWLQYDHVLPNARGGPSILSNMVITCAPCNFARMNATLEEVGLTSLLHRPPVISSWDGLERVFR